MPRYVLTHRLAGKRTDSARRDSRAAIDKALALLKGVTIVSDHGPRDDRARRIVILEVGKAKIEKLRTALPRDVILEPVVERSLHYAVPIVKLATAQTLPQPPSTLPSYTVTVTGGGNSLANKKVLFYMRDRTKQMWVPSPPVRTVAGGGATQPVPGGYAVAFVRPLPLYGFWSMVVAAPPSASTIDCLPLAVAGADGSAWWHKAMGVDTTKKGRGAGINVGVIDSGCGPHPNLANVTLVGYFVNGQQRPANEAVDDPNDIPQGHGTHTAGIIGAKPTQVGDYCGMAPDCNLFHARCGMEAHDIANAIDVLSGAYNCDLINLSLSGKQYTKIEEDAIQAALERGTLCICAAGNVQPKDKTRSIGYPAAFSQCVAVSSIGQTEWAPDGTWAADERPKQGLLLGRHGMFLSATSKYGKGLTCAGPGVGIISTVPSGGTNLYGEQSGTSEASPAVCGALAVILSKNAKYQALPRNSSRAEKARKLLIKHCKSIGLAKKYQGYGLPHV